MGEEMDCGLEVTPWNDPEVIAQPDANKHFIKAEQSNGCASNKPLRPDRSDARNRDWRKVFVVLAMFAVLSLAAAVGAGLGVGLAAQHKSAPLTGSAAMSSVDRSAASQTTNPTEIITMTSAPLTTPGKGPENVLLTTIVASTLPHTQSEKIVTIASQPVISATVLSPVCPADDRLTYIATNKPIPTAGPELEIVNASLAYQIFCYTNYVANSPVRDVQTLYDLNSFQECLNACATYSFQTKPVDFPAFACTGIAWGAGGTLCWLKSNVSSSSANGTDTYPGIDGAVMVQ